MQTQLKNKLLSRRTWVLNGVLLLFAIIYISGILAPTAVKVEITRKHINMYGKHGCTNKIDIKF